MNTVPASAPNLDAALSGGETPGAAALPPLTAFDRCDSPDCSAQAYVRAQLRDRLQLVFCGHHGHELAPALARQGAVIRDDSHLLVVDRAKSSL